jgi:uncharacterized membrane protein YsdA (DUF1294 family)/cold shock CspA family protein
MRFEGTVTKWDDERGFGFIQPDQGGQDVFVHAKAIPRGAPRPQDGERVSFEVELGPHGKKRALRVEPVRLKRAMPRPRRQSPAQWGTATLFAIPAFVLLYFAVAVWWRPPLWIGSIYIVASALAFTAYASDKLAAKRRDRRVPEDTLHLLSLMGGWPGALLAQQFLRHKSVKGEFRAVFWLTVLINVALFVGLCSPYGRALLGRAGA